MAQSEICQNFFKTSFAYDYYNENIHWFLIPAVPFAFAWSFLEKRKSFKTYRCRGRPALYSVLNLLDGGIQDRWGTSFILGAMTTLVYILTTGTLISTTFPPWAKVLLIYVQALEATFLTLPLFVCLSTRFRLLGGVIGLLYALGWAVLSLCAFVVPAKCLMEIKSILPPNVTQDHESNVKNSAEIYQVLDVTVILKVMIEVPAQICFMCIVGKFISRIYNCIRTGQYTHQEKNELSAKTSEIYVKCLMDPIGTKATQSIRKKYLQRFIHNVPGFTYQKHIFCTAFLMAIILYQIILLEQLAVEYLNKLLRSYSKSLLLNGYFEKHRIWNILQGCGIASGIATGIYGVSVIYSLLMTYKRHMLMLYKGKRDFLPEGTEKEMPETHIVRSTQYMGYQIIGLLYGTIICFTCLFIPLTLLCIVFRMVDVWSKVPQLLKQFQFLVYPVSVFLIFRLQIFIVGKFLLQKRLNLTDKQKPLAIDNRKAHDLFKFFMLFVNLSIGFLVFLMRLINNVFLGIFLVPRMDRSLFPKGFESGDKCYMNYVSMLIVDFTHNNPIVRVFCSVLLKTDVGELKQQTIAHRTVQNSTYIKIIALLIPQYYQGHSRARTKWLLAYTLIKNPSIVGTRKRALSGIVLMKTSSERPDVIDRVQRSIASTLFIYIGMILLMLILAFLALGFKAILNF
ncbi:hypothetical protein CHS0354_011067 [Potamilus streckersoni]|uniref:Uncharacterized protein n=1 Tax=Potamilus streckersoni TaxID=2493646 RepID=A0AAE0TMD8_9BIVA|nr:hypothetical protein CHS0354_011067 [Potamilus streckersoni]